MKQVKTKNSRMHKHTHLHTIPTQTHVTCIHACTFELIYTYLYTHANISSNTHMYTCIYTCTHIDIYTHAHTHLHIDIMYPYTHALKHIYTFTNTYILVIYTHMSLYIYAHRHIHINTCTQTHTYVNIHICTQIHMHTYTATYSYICIHIYMYMHTYTYLNSYSEENYPRTPCWTIPVTSELPLLSRRQYFRGKVLKRESKSRRQNPVSILPGYVNQVDLGISKEMCITKYHKHHKLVQFLFVKRNYKSTHCELSAWFKMSNCL